MARDPPRRVASRIQPTRDNSLTPNTTPMIVLSKLAKRCLDNAIRSERVTPSSGNRIFIAQSNVHLNRVYDMTQFRSDELPDWSEYEVAVADTMCWLLAFLERIGCENIDRLMKDVAAYRAENPDKPKRKDALFK